MTNAISRFRWISWIGSCAAAALIASAANAWDALGHANITLAALDAARERLPAWLLATETTARAAFQASEADRWRATDTPAMTHENNLDHYIDVDALEPFGFSLGTMSPFRYEHIAALAAARAAHPERFSASGQRSDPARIAAIPGLLPYAILERYTKLRASFHTLRILESLEGRDRSLHIEQARANIISHIGMLSHFVGDAAQPLHTTIHHHGWRGDNPDGFTTRRSFHAYIDADIHAAHGLDAAALRSPPITPRAVDPSDPWPAILAHIERSFAKVRLLYELDRDGALKGAAGKALIRERLRDGAAALAGFIIAAWEDAEPAPDDIATYLRYEARQLDASPDE